MSEVVVTEEDRQHVPPAAGPYLDGDFLPRRISGSLVKCPEQRPVGVEIVVALPLARFEQEVGGRLWLLRQVAACNRGGSGHFVSIGRHAADEVLRIAVSQSPQRGPSHISQ